MTLSDRDIADLIDKLNHSVTSSSLKQYDLIGGLISTFSALSKMEENIREGKKESIQTELDQIAKNIDSFLSRDK